MENEIKENEVVLNEQDVWDVIEFARQLSSGLYGSTYLTPELINNRLKSINLNPLQAEEDDLASAMENPKEHESQLRAFSQDFETRSMVYKRLLIYLSNMLSFDLTYTSNAEPDDYSKPRYKRDLKKFEDFMDNFEYKKEFRIVVREMLRNDAYFGVFRQVNGKYILQELPPEHCIITGRTAYGFSFAFDMAWFMMGGGDIDLYPPFFKNKYKELISDGSIKEKFRPAYPSDKSYLMGQSQWVNVTTDIGACFKLSPELITRLPFFVPLFNDLILQSLMRKLQKNLNMAAANRMLIGEVPLLNKEIKATVRDSIAVSPELLGRFMALVKNAIGDSIKVASAPLTNMKGIEFEGDNEMYDKYLRTALASSGINTNLIFSSDIKPNAIETQLSLNVDEQMMQATYEQFEDFINFQLSKVTDYFEFYVEFEGSEFFIDREIRFDTAMELFESGIVLPQKIAASIGMKPWKLRKQMEEAEANDFMSKITPPALEQQKRMMEMMPDDMGSPQNPENDVKGEPGRPQSSIKDLGEEGVKTRETGQNIAKKGRGR